MSTVKLVVSFICFAAVTFGLLESLLPDGTIKKQLRLVAATVAVLSLLTIVTKNEFRFEVDAIRAEYTEQEIHQTLQSTAALSIKNNISALLSENSIKYAKIIIDTDIDAEGSIVINKVKLYFDANDIEKAVEASKQIERELGIEVEIGEE